jgi:hypothetical protein
MMKIIGSIARFALEIPGLAGNLFSLLKISAARAEPGGHFR